MDVLGRINESDQASGLRLQFRTSGTEIEKPRTYRELAADGQLECEREISQRQWAAAARAFGIDLRDWPAERPRRDAAGAAARAAQLAQSWRRLRELVDAELTDFTIHCWIEPCALVDATPEWLFIGAPAHVRGWVRERYGDLFRCAARALAGRELCVLFVAPYEDSPCELSARRAA